MINEIRDILNYFENNFKFEVLTNINAGYGEIEIEFKNNITIKDKLEKDLNEKGYQFCSENLNKFVFIKYF